MQSQFLHKKQLQTCGLDAEIITFRSNQDIDVKFDDGTIVNRQNLQNFMNGIIKHPLFNDRTKNCRTKTWIIEKHAFYYRKTPYYYCKNTITNEKAILCPAQIAGKEKTQ